MAGLEASHFLFEMTDSNISLIFVRSEGNKFIKNRACRLGVTHPQKFECESVNISGSQINGSQILLRTGLMRRTVDACGDSLINCAKAMFIVWLACVFVVIAGLIDYSERLQVLPPDHVCRRVLSVNTAGKKVRVKLRPAEGIVNPVRLASNFGFATTAYDLPLVMPPKSAENAEFFGDTLEFEFPLPFVMNYEGDIFCTNEKLYRDPPLRMPHFERNDPGVAGVFRVSLNISEFEESFECTQMLCHGDTFENRWCETRNIGIVSGHFVMATNAHYAFPSTFLSLGGRCPPFDNSQDRLNNEPLIMKQNIHELAAGTIGKGEVVFLTSIGSRQNSLVGVLFDFLLPVIETFWQLQNPWRNKRRRFFVKEMGHRNFANLTNCPIESLPISRQLILIENAVIGLVKADKKCDSTRSPSAHYNRSLTYSEGIGAKLRKSVLKHFNIREIENKTKKLVTFIEQPFTIANIELIRNLVAKSCDFCDVRTITIDQDLSSIIESVSQSDVIIGRTGDGLEHAVWLKPGSHVIELRPYKFWCDDTYQTAATLSNSHYHSVMNTGRIKPAFDNDADRLKAAECRSARSYCETQSCFDVLRSQFLDVELDTFNATWTNLLAIL